jgi:putative acetyltransferase
MAVTPPENVYALDVEKLVSPDITVFGARLNQKLVGVGALRILDRNHGELKSMHTDKAARGHGVGTAMVNQISGFAKSKGLSRVSLETGNFAEFAPARNLYTSISFEKLTFSVNTHQVRLVSA